MTERANSGAVLVIVVISLTVLLRHRGACDRHGRLPRPSAAAPDRRRCRRARRGPEADQPPRPGVLARRLLPAPERRPHRPQEHDHGRQPRHELLRDPHAPGCSQLCRCACSRSNRTCRTSSARCSGFVNTDSGPCAGTHRVPDEVEGAPAVRRRGPPSEPGQARHRRTGRIPLAQSGCLRRRQRGTRTGAPAARQRPTGGRSTSRCRPWTPPARPSLGTTSDTSAATSRSPAVPARASAVCVKDVYLSPSSTRLCTTRRRRARRPLRCSRT